MDINSDSSTENPLPKMVLKMSDETGAVLLTIINDDCAVIPQIGFVQCYQVVIEKYVLRFKEI